ncbi:MAG: ATP-binding cassette domain-containing protein, partial [Anaerostipes faecalis]|nr:ATP-binding cassette domain-containing protein [Anaerostipes faecalis]
MELIRLENVKKIYTSGEVITKAADGIDFTVEEGEFALIIGASGAGKTTVLNILGGMDTATSGAVFVDGEDIAKWNKRQLTKYRRNNIGFVFQFYN